MSINTTSWSRSADETRVEFAKVHAHCPTLAGRNGAGPFAFVVLLITATAAMAICGWEKPAAHGDTAAPSDVNAPIAMHQGR